MKVNRLSETQLVLCFTRGISLADWDAIGSLGREVAPYLRLASELDEVAFVTYGGRRDLHYRRGVAPVRVVPIFGRLPPRLRPVWLRLALRRSRGSPVVIKSNQIAGADLARDLAQWLGGQLVVRAGYDHVATIQALFGSHSWEARRARRLEAEVIDAADAVIVTTDVMRAALSDRHGLHPKEIAVVPNAVAETWFSEPEVHGTSRRIAYVGRLSDEKRVAWLVEAAARVGAVLVVVGQGPGRARLEARAREAGAAVEFLGRISHHDLPGILRSCSVFALASRFEGHPKALIEAMALGLPVVGVDVAGIRGVIEHDVSGLLCHPSVEGLSEAIGTLLNDAGLRTRLGTRARQIARERWHIDRIIELELQVLRRVLGANP